MNFFIVRIVICKGSFVTYGTPSVINIVKLEEKVTRAIIVDVGMLIFGSELVIKVIDIDRSDITFIVFVYTVGSSFISTDSTVVGDSRLVKQSLKNH